MAALLALALLLAALGVFALLSRLEQSLDKVPEGAGQALTREAAVARSALYYNGEKYVRKERLLTLLILGIDDAERTISGSYRNSSQADFLTLAVFDQKAKTCTLIQLNRDTIADVPVLDTFGKMIGYQKQQLALAHTYGNGLEVSCVNTVDAVSRFLYGIKIDNYFALTMDAIPVVNDLVGGVVVTVEDDFTGVDDTLVQGETVLLDANNVEHFVRSRGSMPDDKTNINRMQRQRAYLSGFFEALRRCLAEQDGFVFDAYAQVSDSLVSDCSVYDLNDYATRFSRFKLSDILVPEGESVLGERYMEFYPDEDALQRLVLDVFYERAR